VKPHPVARLEILQFARRAGRLGNHLLVALSHDEPATRCRVEPAHEDCGLSRRVVGIGGFGHHDGAAFRVEVDLLARNERGGIDAAAINSEDDAAVSAGQDLRAGGGAVVIDVKGAQEDRGGPRLRGEIGDDADEFRDPCLGLFQPDCEVPDRGDERVVDGHRMVGLPEAVFADHPGEIVRRRSVRICG
jgi:hypothetical protein